MLWFLREKFLSFFHARAENCFFLQSQSFSCLECMSLLQRQARLALASVKAVCSIAQCQCLLSCHVSHVSYSLPTHPRLRWVPVSLPYAVCCDFFSSTRRGNWDLELFWACSKIGILVDSPGFSGFSLKERLWQTQEHYVCLTIIHFASKCWLKIAFLWWFSIPMAENLQVMQRTQTA